MSTQSKEIKFRVDIEQSSKQKAIDTFNSINAAADKLVATLNKVTHALQGAQKAQGGGFGGGQSGSASQLGQRRTGDPTKKGMGIAESILGDASAIRNAARATESALSASGNNLKQYVDKAIREIERLRKEAGAPIAFAPWGDAERNRLHNDAGWSQNAPTPSLWNSYNTRTSSFEEHLAAQRSGNFWTRRRSLFGGPPSVPSEGGFWGKGGFAGYLEGRGQALGGFLGLGEPGARALGSAGRFIGTHGGAMTVGALGAVAAYDYASRSFEKNRAGQVDFTLNQPFMRLGAAAGVANIHNRLYGAIQGRDLATVAAYRKTLNDPEVMKSLANTSLLSEKLNLAAGTTPLSLGANKERIKAVLSNLAGRGLQSAMEFIAGADLNPAEKADLQQIALKTAAYSAVGDNATKFGQSWDSHLALQGGMFNTMSKRIGANAFSRIATMRMAGLGSGGFTKRGTIAYEDFQSKLAEGGWEWSDRISGHQAILGIGSGYRKAISATWGIQGGRMVGLGNIDQLVKTGGILGGSVGAAREFAGRKSLLQRSVGKGGLDVAVGNELFTQFGQMAMGTGQFGAGNTAANYIGLAAGLVGGVDERGKATLDVAEQQRRMMQLGAGNAAFAGITQGKQAPMYQATSLLGAISAMGGYSMGAENLSRMDPTLLASIARGGKVPDYYWGQGIGRDQAKAFLRYQNRMPFAEVTDEMVTGEAGGLLKEIRAAEAGGGSFIDVLNSKVRGLSGRDRAKTGQMWTERMAGIIQANLGWTGEQASGALMAPLIAQEDWAKPLMGKGVGVGAPKGLEGEQAKQQAEILKAEAGLGKVRREDIQDASNNIVKAIQDQTAEMLAANRGAKAAASVVGDGNLGSVEASVSSARPRKARPK